MGHLTPKLVLVFLWFLAQARRTSETGQFIGASMSFAILNGTNGFEVRLDLISGWVLGLGPCGINCSRASINSNTKYTRKEVLREQGDTLFFGNWTVEIKMNGTRHSNTTLINQEVYSHLTESVLDVSEKARWEQDWMVVHYPITPGATYMDIIFEGLSWRNLSVQGENKDWHLQMKAASVFRSDTGKPNSSPQAFSKPFYRLLLDKDNYIRIATIDPDGDHVECSMAAYVEGGIASKKPLRNVTVTKDCVITVPSSRTLGYYDGSLGAVAIIVRDYNIKDISYGGGFVEISSIGVQFLVQFLDNISEPSFIFPTPEGNHRFNIYSGTTWKIDVYAEPISPALIDHFSCLGRQHEDVRMINVKNILVPNHENVKMATMMWTPNHTDVGEHIVCVGVEDSVGMDSSDQRCYMLDVKPPLEVNQSVNFSNNKPYFINIPEKDVLWCDANATCIFPMYAKTPTTGANIISIWLGKYYVDWAKNDSEIVKSGNGVFKIDISVRHMTGGSTSLCFYAQDSTSAISDETCINPRIIPPDPCAKAPCEHGICRRSPDDISQFSCECPSDHFYGQFCEKELNDCPPDRCLHGTCQDAVGPIFFCRCTKGWIGVLCDANINNCTNESCNNHGICIDKDQGFSCDCFQRYQGDNCSIDICNSSQKDKSCDQVGCHADSCTNNGVCTSGGICHCSLGYEGSANCDTGKTDHPSQQISFVEPTLADGSIITCYNNNWCNFSVFVAGGTNPEVGIQYISEGLKTLMNASTPEKADYIPGIQNLFESFIRIEPLPVKTYLGQQYVCLEAHERGAVASELSSRCFNILYTEDPKHIRRTQEYADQNKTVKFVDPTPKGQSQLTCKVNEYCHLFVFTNKDNSLRCREVVASSKVYVQPVRKRQSDCFTDISFNFTDKGIHTVCLKADDTDGEKRCFTIDIIVPSEDPCLSNPCKNIGRCLKQSNSTFKCICGKEYTGQFCEKGPCLATNWQCKHGYCEVNQDAQTCFCTLGYKGQNCSDVISDEVQDPLNNGSVFTDTFIPKEVVCVNNKPCVIPFAISGSYPDPYGPTVDFGFVSPTVQINGFNRPKKANSTNGTYISEVSITPKLPGHQKVCLQTMNINRVNADEVCFHVDVKPDASTFFGDTNKPHFTTPSITQNSTIVCTIGVTCHMMFMVSSGKSNANNCPTMNLTEGLEKDFHIFSHCEPCTDGPTAAGNCSMDLVFNPSSSYFGQTLSLCLEAQLLWKKVIGEKRCFNMEVKNGNESSHGPCSNLHCKSGGFCDAENAKGEPVCHCPKGYSGNTCEKDESTSITNNTNRPSAGNFVLPEEIICNYNESCSIPLQILGQPPSIPFLETGHVPPTIDVEHLLVNSTNPTVTNFEGYLKIRPTSNGTQRVCIQSKDNRTSSRVCEEICFNVRVSGEFSRQPVDMSRPYYIDPTLPDGSTVMCQTGSECHIVMFTLTKTSNCPTVTEVSGYTGGLHIFPPASMLEYKCVTDISYIPPKDVEGQPKKICLQTSLPGLKGEIRCYNVISRADANLTKGLCINKKCENGGQCLSNPLDARCICRLGYSGVECADTSETVDPPTDLPTLNGIRQPVFIDLAIPDTLICYEKIECWLPVTVKGDVSHKPTVKFGHVDSALSQGTPELDDGSAIGVYNGNLPFTPSSIGQYRLCVQTTDPVSQVNVDELCCNVTVHNSSLQPTQPPFQKPTLNANSTVKCAVNTNCHILTYLDPENGTCCDLTQTGLVDNLFLFPPSMKDGKCVVDTIFTPSSNQTGENLICLKTRNSHNQRCLNVQVEQVVKARGPCSNLHCKNGGFCDAENATSQPLCYCPSGYSGKTCDDDVSTSITNNSNRPAVGNLALPLQIECLYNKSCSIPLQLLGQPPNTPFVEPGHVPPTINVENLVVNSTNPGGKTFEGYLKIKATGNGTQRVCIQGKDHKNSSRVLEEICFNVHVADQLSRPPANMSQPCYIDPTLPDGSTVMCKTESACHILMYTSKTESNCPIISEVVNYTRGLHILSPVSRMGYDCVTDVSYIPPKDIEGQKSKICLQASLSGLQGEIRCYHVVSLANANLTTGLCVNMDCKNGGQCMSNTLKARCICRLGYSGVNCTVTSETVDPPTNLLTLNGIPQPVFIDLAIPDTLICYEKIECWLPVTVKGDVSHKPTVKFGHIDPTLSPGIPILDDGSATGVYSGSVSFLPSSVGQYRLCIQTADPISHVNVDEICCNVTVLNSLLQPTQPPFMKPTLNENSTVKCAVNTNCHILTYLDPENGTCSDLTQTGLVDNLFLFPPSMKDGKCVVDTIFTPSSNQTGENIICLNTRYGHNPRCLNVQVEQIVKGHGPCSSLHCKNGGFCDAESETGQPLCHCPSGYSGITCDDDVSTSITNNTNRPAVGNLAVPLQIECIYNESCYIPLQLLGQPPNTPFVEPGHVPPTINVENLVVNSTNPGGKTFEGYLKIKATGNGTQRVCIQGKDYKSSSRVLEEICFNVQVTDSFSRPQANMSHPYYIDPTLPDGSTVMCKTESACHILMYASKTASNCPTISEVSNYTRGLHIFSPASRMGYDCVTDVSYIPPKEMEGQKRKICLQVSLSGLLGEIRCYQILSLANANLTTGLCVNMDCKNGGQCMSNTLKARCICRLGYSGVNCTVTSETVDPPTNLLTLNGIPQPVFIDLAIPDTLICYEKIECWLPVTVKGDVSHKPTVKFGHIDPTLSPGIPILDDGSATGVYSGSVSFLPSSVGQYRLCIQTADPISHVNVDEICCNVTVLNSLLQPTQPPFMKPTLNENSTVKCAVNTSCHILTYLDPENGTCSDLTQTGLVDNLFLFPPSMKDGKCVVDTIFTPSSNQTGENIICLNTRYGHNPRCLNVQVEQIVKGHGPCSSLHCKNGGFCDAESETGQPLCHCPSGYSGITCDDDVSTSITNNTNRPAVGNLAVPLQIECIYNESCYIPLQLLGQPPNNPFVEPGHVPPTINVENLVVNSTNPGGKTFEGYLKIKATGNGTQRVCIQGKDHKNSSRVLEEICFNVQVTDSFSRPQANMSHPYYIDPTLPDGSTVMCKTESACHILMYASKTASNCPTISEVSNYTRGLHIFSPASRMGYDCVTDVSYIPPKEMEGQKRKICLQVSLSGLLGEIRCYQILSLANANLSTGLCINKECKNSGQCLSNSQEARCICRLGYSGVECTDTSESVDPPKYLPTSNGRPQPVLIDLAIPDTLICYENIDCWLPVTVKGDVNHNKPTVTFGHIDPTLSKGILTLDDGSVFGVYSGNVSFTPSSVGEYRLCIQTADSVSQVNVDEMCCNVTVLTSSPQPAQTPFQKPTLNDNSTVKCQVNTTCHILTYLDSDNETCPDLTQAGLVDNVYLFPAIMKDGKCFVDTTFTPSGNQTGSNRICMNIRNSGNTRCLNVQVEQTIKVPAPCKKKHCQNNGTCRAIDWSNAECNCTKFFTGPQCESEISTSLPTTSKSTTFPDTSSPSSTSASPTNKATSLLTTAATQSPSPESFSTTALSRDTAKTTLSTTSISHSITGTSQSTTEPSSSTSHSTTGTSQSTTETSLSASHTNIGLSQSTMEPSSSTSLSTTGMIQATTETSSSASHSPIGTSHSTMETSSSASYSRIRSSQSTMEPSTSTSHSTTGMIQATTETSSSASHSPIGTSHSTMETSSSTSLSTTGMIQATTETSSSASHSPIGTSHSTMETSSSASYSRIRSSQSTMEPSTSTSHSTTGMIQATTETSSSASYSPIGTSHSTMETSSSASRIRSSQSTMEPSTSTSHSTTSLMCSATAEISTAERARELAKAGRVSCFCNITTPGTNDTKWVQVIRPRPAATTSQLTKAGAVGAGAMIGVMAVVGAGIIVVKKLQATKKIDEKRKPLPRAKPRVSPTKF